MPTFKLSNADHLEIKDGAESITIAKKSSFDKFNESILGLGNFNSKSKPMEAISVIFDLEGFTNFCKQIDPHLAVPEYLNEFVTWIFKTIKSELISKSYTEGYYTWADLPFLSKFLGDGILFLWDTKNMSDVEIRNVVVSMQEICKAYSEKFLPRIAKNIVSPPQKLRCGIARGTVYSVGNGNDFVGPCINMSARLQKLHSLTFCFSRRGIDPKGMEDSNIYTTKKVDIRGIGAEELVCVINDEFKKLSIEDRNKFKDA